MTGEGKRGKAPDAFIEKVCNDLCEWARLNKGIAKMVNEFCDDYGAPLSLLDVYPSLWPMLQEAKDKAKATLGYRNYRKAVDGVSNWPAVKHMLHQFHKDFKDAEEFHADLKAKAQEKHQPGATKVEVIVQAAENTDVKPMKRNADVIREQEEKENSGQVE